ncbi:MAG TPA: hypothetical protein VES67_23845 [Vicinamibacterales bacterium]|nr:hypothetical protein [Vicinamibacterales bacterium]
MTFALCLLPFALAFAQEPPAPIPATGATAAVPMLRVFLDCYECDTEYQRQNVTFVDYVRDRTDADLHVLVTTQGTGSGGSSWTVKFIGLGRLQRQDRTFTFTTEQTATSDDRRKAFSRIFKIGLVGYAADTSIAPQLDLTWTKPAATKAAVRDRWNSWVFRINLNGNFNGERTSKSSSSRISFSSSRTTADWKLNVSVGGNVNKNTFEVDEDRTVRSQRDNWFTEGLIVKSHGPRTSSGLRASMSHDSFSNIDRSVRIAPAVEFDFFPYKESNRRSLAVQYTIGMSRYQYREVTIFDKTEETVPNHSVSLSVGLRQPWGSLNAYSQLSQHLNHRDRWRSAIWGSTDVRLFKGFSFNVFAEYSKIKDQISLRKGGASTEEVLLRIRQLATDYSYYYGFGISYSFGSIFDNIVNPRFSGGGFFFFF